ncbi:hypothetical protein L3073_12900 [Ancylomarina sp. DW003]|nr:hypothetical protein [Ancylomarina sp. DW003]MDE5423110.1 hypothetical protein [Ancylomarina sp. DW003]
MKIFRFIHLLILIYLSVSLGVGCDKSKGDSEFVKKDFLKFSDFGCKDVLWNLKPEYSGSHYIISNQSELEEYITSECIPQIDFTKYIVLIGNKHFTTGTSLYDEKVEESNSEIVYTVTFLTNEAAVVIGVNYHVVIERSSINKNIKIIETTKNSL